MRLGWILGRPSLAVTLSPEVILGEDFVCINKKVVLPTRAPPNPPSVQIPLSSTEREQARFLNSTFSTPYLPYLISQYKKYIKIYVAISAS